MKRWSKLQRELYKIISDTIDFQIHCVSYPMRSQCGRTDLPRYFITLNKEIIWDYPKQFVAQDGCIYNLFGEHFAYPHITEISDISSLIKEYIDTPKEETLSKVFVNDCWGLINILRAADKRVGYRRLDYLLRKTHNKAAIMVIKERLQKKNG